MARDRVARGRDGWLFWNYAQALCARKGVGGGIWWTSACPTHLSLQQD